MAERPKSVANQETKMGRIGNRPYWLLNLALFIRAAHQVGAAVFLAVFLLDGKQLLPPLYLVVVFSSGVVLMLVEWVRHRQIFREVSGICTIVKLALIGAAYHGFLSAPVTVLFAFILASVCAHAPKSVRHRLLF